MPPFFKGVKNMEFTVHRIPCGNVNAYLVAQGENAILIDTGQKKYRERVLSACRPYRTQLLVLTHGHLDHAESAARLRGMAGYTVYYGHGRPLRQ